MSIIKVQPAGSSACCTLYFEFTDPHFNGVGFCFFVASWFALFFNSGLIENSNQDKEKFQLYWPWWHCSVRNSSSIHLSSIFKSLLVLKSLICLLSILQNSTDLGRKTASLTCSSGWYSELWDEGQLSEPCANLQSACSSSISWLDCPVYMT